MWSRVSKYTLIFRSEDIFKGCFFDIFICSFYIKILPVLVEYLCRCMVRFHVLCLHIITFTLLNFILIILRFFNFNVNIFYFNICNNL